MEQVRHARLTRFIPNGLMQRCCHLGNKHEIIAATEKHCRLLLSKTTFLASVADRDRQTDKLKILHYDGGDKKLPSVLTQLVENLKWW